MKRFLPFFLVLSPGLFFSPQKVENDSTASSVPTSLRKEMIICLFSMSGMKDFPLHHHTDSASSSFCKSKDLRDWGYSQVGSRSTILLPFSYSRLYLLLRNTLLPKIVFCNTSLLAIVPVKGAKKEGLLYFTHFE